ncbi:MAG TPA: ion channel [Candidatus Polarisedimenticolaceae bacterium]|nr:ion channel [Candidatus Polarisedimenticolaceae bacterium]
MTDALRSRYTWLLAGLLSLVGVLPFVQQARANLVVLHALSVALIAAGVLAVANRRRSVVVALSLALPSLALSVAQWAGAPVGVTVLRDALQTAFAGYTAAIILADVVRDERVNAEKIRGAVCVFFMIGATWAFAYATLLHLDPSAFAFPGAHEARPGDVFYFSFVTLTTVGYGDVVPVSPAARQLAWLEAAVGQLYLAVLVARLVGLHTAYGARTD